MDKILNATNAGGTITIPGSKSQTIRALLIATFSREISTISNALDSQDTRSCMHLCSQIGARLSWNDDHTVLHCDATAVGTSGRSLELDCGNSGTTLYLAAGLLASSDTGHTLTGDSQLQRRPVGPLLQALETLGATVIRKNGEFPPFFVKGPLRGGQVSISCPTSQYLSSLLLACPLAAADTVIDIPLLYERPYVDMTLRWLEEQQIACTIDQEYKRAWIGGNQQYHGLKALVPGDFSSASFFFCMAAIGKTTISVGGLDRNDSQGDKQILEVLETMGCTVQWDGNTVTVSGPRHLAGGTFDLNAMPDTLPILAATACFAEEDVSLVNVAQARIKETDRIAVMHEELGKLGAVIVEQEDGMTIKAGHKLVGTTVCGHDDHRVIMALAAASIAIEPGIRIAGTDAAAITFPTFFDLFDSITGGQA
jgi:3-phosphoshikimate 1-carboxyvinyltransferase